MDVFGHESRQVQQDFYLEPGYLSLPHCVANAAFDNIFLGMQNSKIMHISKIATFLILQLEVDLLVTCYNRFFLKITLFSLLVLSLGLMLKIPV